MVIALGLLGWVPLATADTVRLRSGEELTGYIIDQSDRSVMVVGADGVPVQVPRGQVEWMAYIGDARARTAWRQRLLAEQKPAPALKRATTTVNRGYFPRNPAGNVKLGRKTQAARLK